MPVPGPIKISLEGTFTEKPRLYVGGEEVAYDRLRFSYLPEEKISYADMDGKVIEDVLPEICCLEFALTANVGQLEANVSYRVKANKADAFTVERVEKIERLQKLEARKCEECTDTKLCSKHMKPEMKPKKEAKINVQVGMSLRAALPQADVGSITYRKNIRQEMLEGIIDANK